MIQCVCMSFDNIQDLQVVHVDQFDDLETARAEIMEVMWEDGEDILFSFYDGPRHVAVIRVKEMLGSHDGIVQWTTNEGCQDWRVKYHLSSEGGYLRTSCTLVYDGTT